MQHALRYVWSIPSARAEQKRIILSLNIPIRSFSQERLPLFSWICQNILVRNIFVHKSALFIGRCAWYGSLTP